MNKICHRFTTFHFILAILFLLPCFSSSASALTITYTYDSDGQLTKADYGNAGSISYTYDVAGNILTKAVSGPSMTLTVSRTGSGTVTSTPAGISCGTTCSSGFNQGTSVTLDASPDTGYVFSGWAGSCVGTDTCSVTMDASKNVTATFTVDTTPPATSASIPAGTYTSSQSVILTPNENATIYYTTDGTDPTIAGGTRVRYTSPIPINATTTLKYYAVDAAGNSESVKTAVYTITVSYTLTVAKTGSGTVASTPAGIDCGSACSASFTSGTSVSLNATASSGYTFTGWSGSCTGTTCMPTMDAARNVTATFAQQTQPTISFSGTVKDLSLTNTIPFATVQVVNNPSLMATSDMNGNFIIPNIPANTDFSIRISKQQPPQPPFIDTYSGILNFAQDKTTLLPYVLYGAMQVSSWQPYYQSGKGTIISKVVNKDNSSQAIEGATVSCTTSVGTCQVAYYNGTAFTGTSTSTNGIYVVYGLDENAQVTVTAAKDGWTFSTTHVIAHANGISEEIVLGTSGGAGQTATLSLTTGWNLISFPLQPTDTAITAVLNGISSNYSIVWAYDAVNGWKKYQPGKPSDLTTMEAGKGYWIKMNQSGTLSLTGQSASSQTIPLKTGWNLVGWNKTTPTSVADALTNISSITSIVWAYDALAGWKKYQPSKPSDLSDFTSGLGFWVKVNADIDWTQ